MSYSKVLPLGSGEFALTKENFRQINDAVYDLKTLTFNVKDYGAVGDGVANDTTAIQAADTAARAAGGITYLPAASYKANLVLATNSRLMAPFRVIGAGPGVGASISAYNSGQDVIAVTPGDGNYAQNIHLENLLVYGGTNAFASYSGIAFLTLKNVELGGATGAQFYAEGWLEEVLFDRVRMSGGNYCFQMARVGNPHAGTNNYIDKATFFQTYFAGGKNSIRIECQVMDAVTWDQCNVAGSSEHGTYIDAGARGLTFNQLSTEGCGSSGKKNRTTGSITSGTPTLVVASATGYAIGDVVTVKGAKGFNGDLTANVTNVVGTTITLDANATFTVASVAVTNAKWDDIFFAGTVASPANIVFIGGVIGGEGANGKLRYAINASGITSSLTLVSTGANPLTPVYDPARTVNVLGGSIPLRRPPQNNGHPFLGIVATSDGAGEGGGGFLGAPRGEDFTFGMPDSAGNGSGTFGKWSWRKGDGNKTQIMYLDAGTKRLTIEDGSLAECLIVLTYGTTIATNATSGNFFKITATDGVAFTISNPTNPFAGQSITYDIKNSSGGALGAITWGAAFLLAGAFTNPANTKRRTIRFYYDGTNWVEINRAAADI